MGKVERHGLVLAVALGGLPVALGGLPIALGGLPVYFVSWSCSPIAVHVYTISNTDFCICFFKFLVTHKQTT